MSFMLNGAAFLLFGGARGQTISGLFFVRCRQVPLVRGHRRNLLVRRNWVVSPVDGHGEQRSTVRSTDESD